MFWKITRYAVQTAVYGFALVGLFLVGGFFAVKFHLTDIRGMIDLNDRYFQTNALENARRNAAGSATRDPAERKKLENYNYCVAAALQAKFPENTRAILNTYTETRSLELFSEMLTAIKLRQENNAEVQNAFVTCDGARPAAKKPTLSTNAFQWTTSEEWLTFKAAITKDTDVIDRVSTETGIPARLIVTQIIAEQLRLFNTHRDVFKQFFQPLKILGNETQFSLGVAGIKEETAIKIEQNLKERASPYYLGPAYEDMLDFSPAATTSPDVARIERLTDPRNRYYSYLYTALLVKQLEKQWEKAGYPVSSRPEIVSTLFNIGFNKSVPKANPQVGGAPITIGDIKYSYGGLAYEFYYSGELLDAFPYPINLR